jgi:transcriptional regulator with XRE-family HTH domain
VLNPSELVQHARRRAKLTQGQLAVKVGCNPQYVSQIECGRREVSWDMLCRLVAACGLRIDWSLKKGVKRGQAKTQPTEAATGAGA